MATERHSSNIAAHAAFAWKLLADIAALYVGVNYYELPPRDREIYDLLSAKPQKAKLLYVDKAGYIRNAGE